MSMMLVVDLALPAIAKGRKCRYPLHHRTCHILFMMWHSSLSPMYMMQSFYSVVNDEAELSASCTIV